MILLFQTSPVAQAYGMSTGEIVIAVLTTIGLVLGILKVWIQSQTEIAQIKIGLANMEKEFNQHKVDDAQRYEMMRKENREDHGKLFDKIDNLMKKS